MAKADPTMPEIDPSVLNYHAKAGELDWADREAVIEYQVGAWQLLFNHALLQGGEQSLNRLNEVTAPVLIIHGREDRILPYVHGLALKAELPHAELLTLVGTGHELHPDD